MARERREHARLVDDSLRFRWPGARRDEPVVDLSRSGAKLLTIRSAPVGSSVELEIFRPDTPLLEVMATVRRVERPGRRTQQGGSSENLRLGLAVEFRGLGDEQIELLDELIAAGGGVPGGEARAENGSGMEGDRPDGRLWDTEVEATEVADATEATEATEAAEAAATVADDRGADSAGEPTTDTGEAPKEPPQRAVEEVDAAGVVEAGGSGVGARELEARLARAESLAAEAIDKLAQAQRRIAELEADPGPEAASVEADRVAEENRTARTLEEEAAESTRKRRGRGPISGAVRAFRDLTENPLSTRAFDRAKLIGEAARSGATEGAAASEPAAEKPAADGEAGASAHAEQHSSGDSSATFMAAVRGERSQARSAQVEPPADAAEPAAPATGAEDQEEARTAFEEIELGTPKERSQPTSAAADSEDGSDPFAVPAGDGAEQGSASAGAPAPVQKTGSDSGVTSTDGESVPEVPWPEPEEQAEPGGGRSGRSRGRAVSVSIVEEVEATGEEASGEDATTGDASTEDVGNRRAEVAAEAEDTEKDEGTLTHRDLAEVTEMISTMAHHDIEKTARFARLEPVSRADIQVSDWLRESDTLRGLEERAKGRMELDELHRVLWVFFQRGLIVLRPRA